MLTHYFTQRPIGLIARYNLPSVMPSPIGTSLANEILKQQKSHFEGMAMSKSEVRLRGIKKHYGKVEVTHGLDLDIGPGEFVVFVGDHVIAHDCRAGRDFGR